MENKGPILQYNEKDNTVTIPVDFWSALKEHMNLLVKKVAKQTAKELYSEIYSIEAQRKNFDNRLFNVSLLLKNYRMFKLHTNIKIDDMLNIDDDKITAIEILDSFQNCKGIGKEEIKLESIVKSTLCTKKLIDYVDEMIGVYKQRCYESGKPEDPRRVDVLETMYLKENIGIKTVEELLAQLGEKWNCDPRTIRRDIKHVIESLTAILYGVDGINMLEDKKRRRALNNAKKEE